MVQSSSRQFGLSFHNVRDRQAASQTARQTDRQTDRQTGAIDRSIMSNDVLVEGSIGGCCGPVKDKTVLVLAFIMFV